MKNAHPEDIKASVRKSGATMRQLAFGAGLHPSALSHCLHVPLPAANLAIAEFLGARLHELWPEWFDQAGEVRPDARKSSTLPHAAHRQKGAAA